MPEAASLPGEALLVRLSNGSQGLASAEAVRRLARVGPNAVRSHHARALAVLARQSRSALLLLLLVTALVSAFLGERTDAAIIGAILALSVGLGFLNEYRAERAVEALHEQIRHDVPPSGTGGSRRGPPGARHDRIVPADLRILEAANLECDEAVPTGEPEPVEKTSSLVGPGSAVADLSSCAFMGTTVRHGGGVAVVVATGRHPVGPVAERIQRWSSTQSCVP